MVLEILYRRHYNLLLNYGMKFYPDTELVKDCIQDLFIKLHQSNRLSPTECVRAYLLKSLKNLLKDKLASLKETEDVEAISFSLSIEDATLTALFRKNDEEIRLSKQLLRAFRQLPVNQREIIYLRFIKGLSYKEIANVLGIAPQSGMNLVSRALAKLRTLLQPEAFFLLLLLQHQPFSPA